MKDEDLFSQDGPPPTTSDHERGGDGDRRALSPASPLSQEAPPAHPLRRNGGVPRVITCGFCW
jgi:dienelactone hydrolase